MQRWKIFFPNLLCGYTTNLSLVQTRTYYIKIDKEEGIRYCLVGNIRY